jgi:hypothetical protein
MDVREGGVSGAPNVTASGAGALSDEGGGFPGAGSGTVCGASGFGVAGEWRGENGGVRGRAWLGGGAALRGVPMPARGDDTRSVRGTGGGHAPAAGDAGVVARARTGFTPTGVLPSAGAAAEETCSSSPQLTAAPTGISPPQTEQRARIDTLVIFAGSTRNTERHSGQETFIGSAR